MGRWIAPLLFCAAALAVWPFRSALTANAIAARSPEHLLPACVFLLALYAVKSLSVVFPLSVLTAAGGLLFPFPVAVFINLCGVLLVQLIPYLLGRLQHRDLEALTARFPRLAACVHPTGRSVFLLRLAGASPGDLVSMYLGAVGISCPVYLSAGLMGSFPRVLSATILGSALWEFGSNRFWLSFLPGAALTALSLFLWKFQK